MWVSMPIATSWYEIVLPPFVTLAVIVVAFMLVWAGRGRLAELFADLGLQRVSAFGVDLQFVNEQAEAAYKKQQLGAPSREDLAAIRDAATYLAPLAARSHVLWVDDKPGGNAVERATLLAWQIDVQAERTTDDALLELSDPLQRYDLVISDWRREGEGDSDDAPAGLDLIERMPRSKFQPRVIYYHGVVPSDEQAARRQRAHAIGAIGATSNPGELFRWTLLELARVVVDPQQKRPRRSQPADESGRP